MGGDVLDGAAESGMMQGARITFEFAGYSGEAADFARFRVKWNLIGDVPLDEPLRGGDELDLVFDDVTFLDNAFVVGRIALLDVVGEEIRVGASHDFLLVVETHEVGELLVDVDEVPIGVLDEKEETRDAVEKKLARIDDAIIFDELGKRIVGGSRSLHGIRSSKRPAS